MIALWLLYAVAIGALFTVAAVCAERALRLGGRQARVVWVASIAATLLVPVGAALLPRQESPVAAPSTAPSGGAADPGAVSALLARARTRDVTAPIAERWMALDRPLLALCAVAALVGVAWVVRSRRRLRRAARTWEPATVAGESVLISPDAGPAAVSDAGGQIVLPRWALALGDERLTLMLAHERSHLTARDPQLLTLATAAVAFAPWNVALWWQLRRLRLAVELDCDGRVLRRHPNVAAYGALLLDVAQRGPHRSLGFATALSAPTPVSSLERRIRVMTRRPPRHTVARVLGLTTFGVSLVVAACEAPHPTAVRPQSRVPLTRIANAAPEMTSQDGLSLDQIRVVLADSVPRMTSMRANRVFVVADERGRARRIELMRVKGAKLSDSSTVVATLDPSTIKSVDVRKLTPGQLTPDSVGVVWIALKPTTAAVDLSRDTIPTATVRRDTTPVDRYRIRADTIRFRTLADSVVSADRRKPIIVVDGQIVPSTTPLVIVDGVVSDSGLTIVSRFPADSIATVEVLKGQAAVEAYGERAREGVILVTTKRPKKP